MQDRFRFRVWQTELQVPKMKYNSGIGFIKNQLDDTDCVIMQSTGVKDKNGKLIFEGDIVFYKIGSIKCREVVKWNQTRCGWVKGYQDLCTYQKYCEVIGNIYENSNLLGEGK